MGNDNDILKPLVGICVLEFLMKGGNPDEAIRAIDQKMIETDNQKFKEYLEEAKRFLSKEER